MTRPTAEASLRAILRATRREFGVVVVFAPAVLLLVERVEGVWEPVESARSWGALVALACDRVRTSRTRGAEVVPWL